MAAALVGSLGAVNVTAVTTANTPAYGTGQSRAVGNTLACWVSGHGSNVLPTTPSGWSIAAQLAGTACSATLFTKVAAGADAAPTIASAAPGWDAMLAEFSGLATATPLDRAGTNAGTTSPRTATTPGVDAAPGELILVCAATQLSVAGTTTSSVALNNGATEIDNNNDATSILKHYRFGYGFTTGNASADSAVFTSSATAQGLVLVLASFKLAAPVVLLAQQHYRRPGAAHNRRSVETSRGRF